MINYIIGIGAAALVIVTIVMRVIKRKNGDFGGCCGCSSSCSSAHNCGKNCH